MPRRAGSIGLFYVEESISGIENGSRRFRRFRSGVGTLPDRESPRRQPGRTAQAPGFSVAVHVPSCQRPRSVNPDHTQRMKSCTNDALLVTQLLWESFAASVEGISHLNVLARSLLRALCSVNKRTLVSDY